VVAVFCDESCGRGLGSRRWRGALDTECFSQIFDVMCLLATARDLRL
jgi:hypothetical protein